MQQQVALYINGEWCQASDGRTADVVNPATAKVIGKVPLASQADLDRALAAAEAGFKVWRKTSAYDRSKLLRKAAQLLRERADDVARLITLEQGKPLAEGKLETLTSADVIDWFAEEGRRAYGRVIPARMEGVRQIVTSEPIGPVAGFSPWNFPVSQAVRKIGGALGAGCSIIIKPPEETPSSCVELIRVFHDAGLPPGVLNMVFGVPAEISSYLVPSPIIRKVSFTGSVPVGKHLGALSAQHMKRSTMELGGHAPLIVFEDADPAAAAGVAAAMKFRNAGQVCVSPSRFFIHEKVYDSFVGRFTDIVKSLKVGDGLEPGTQMGPLANSRRVDAMERLVGDAVERGAKIATGGNRIGNQGYFFEPTVLTDVPPDARLLHEEPFGPVAPMLRFTNFDEVMTEANSLPFGLAAYAFTRSAKTANAVADGFESGMVSINHAGLALPETPFGGIKDSGHGSEGGIEGLNAYLVTKFVSHLGI